MLIIARTDAIAVEGFESALERGRAYAEAGADVVFVEALQDTAQMRATVERLGSMAPLMVNLIEGGRTPVLPLEDLRAMGFNLAIFPGGAVRAIAKHLTDFYSGMVRDGSTDAFRDRMLDFNGLNALVGTPELLAHGETYSAERMEAAMKRLTM
jgi:2-methylisocitrate lyase-like PEP mutase family enzyme